MGKIYKTDGMVIATEPANGNDFQLSELRNVVGGYIEVVTLRDGLMMVVNEEGKLQNLPVNYNATTVLQNMAVIYGRPSWSSKFLIATVNSCGRFEPLQFKFTDKGALGMVDYTDYVYNPSKRCKEAINKQFDGIHHQERFGKCVGIRPVSVRLAIQEGWYTKNGSKWQTMTRQMLMYRAASMWTNAYAPELSMGMRTVEEQQDILDANVEAGLLPAKLRARTMKSHCSLDTCRETLLANDLSKVNNIVLIHLSPGNSNAEQFKNDIASATGKNVYVADKGMNIKFNKSPF